MSKPKPNIKSLLDMDKLLSIVQKLRGYSLISFVVLVVLLYGFIVLRINTLSGMQPSDSEVSSHVQAAKSLRIDQSVVQQLKSLQDNSVSVQGLFEQARSNPFQE